MTLDELLAEKYANFSKKKPDFMLDQEYEIKLNWLKEKLGIFVIKCLVFLPSEESNCDFYEEAIELIETEFGLNCQKVKFWSKQGGNRELVEKLLNSSSICIADITEVHPYTAFGIGLAVAKQKKLILTSSVILPQGHYLTGKDGYVYYKDVDDLKYEIRKKINILTKR